MCPRSMFYIYPFGIKNYFFNAFLAMIAHLRSNILRIVNKIHKNHDDVSDDNEV